jgi:hypothetical protein
MANDKSKTIKFQIDKVHYEVTEATLTGRQLRDQVTPPIPEDRDLLEEVHQGDDPKIGDTDVVTLHNGQKFYTAPGRINPGS